MKGKIYKIIAILFVSVLLLGEIALFLTNSSQPTSQISREEGIKNITVISWGKFVKVNEKPDEKCIKKLIEGRNYYVVELKDTLCAFLYNATVRQTLKIDNRTFIIESTPITLPNYSIEGKISYLYTGENIIGLENFSLITKNKTITFKPEIYNKKSLYVYSIPFENRSILEKLNLSSYIKDVVLVNNSTKYKGVEGVKAIGDGYIVVERNITNITALNIEGTPLPTIVKLETYIDELKDYLTENVTEVTIYYINDIFIPPTKIVLNEKDKKINESLTIDALISGNTVVKVIDIK